MKQAVMEGPHECRVVEVSDPSIADNYAKVKVLSAPLCTEYRGLQNGGDRRGFGHEAAGEVVEIGPKVKAVTVGDRVVVMPQDPCGKCDLCTSGEYIYCQSKRRGLKICGSETGAYGVAQYLIKQDWLLVPIPDDISYDHASMACCGFGPAFNSMQSMNVGAGDTVLVSGLGPVGLGAVAVALYRGARVLGLDPSEYRRDLAQQMGAEIAFDPSDANVKEQILNTSKGRGVQMSVETSGAESAPQFLVDVARRRGKLAFIGWGGPMTSSSIIGKGLRLYGCWHWNHMNDTERMMNTIRGSQSRIDQMITHTFPIDRIAEAMNVQVSGQCGKVIVKPFEGA